MECRTQVITLLPRFLVVNKLPVAVRLLPQRGLFTAIKQCSSRPLQPGEAAPMAASYLLDVDRKATTLVQPGQTCVLYSFEDVSRGPLSSFLKAGTGRKRRRWVRASCDTIDKATTCRSSVSSVYSSLRSSASSSAMLSSLSFSSPLSMDDVGESHVWLPISPSSSTTPTTKSLSSDQSSPGLLVSSSVLLVDSSVVMTLNDVSHSPPYRLENRTTNMSIRVRQSLGKKYRKRREKWSDSSTLRGTTSSKYCLDCPSRDVNDEVTDSLKNYDIYGAPDRKAEATLDGDTDNVGDDDDDDGDDDLIDEDDDSWLMLPPHSWKSFLWEDPKLERHIELVVSQREENAKRQNENASKAKPVALGDIISLDEIGPIDTFEFTLTAFSPSHDSFVRRKCAIGGYIYADGATRVLVLHEVSPTDRLLSRQFSMSLRPSPIKIRRAAWSRVGKSRHRQLVRKRQRSGGGNTPLSGKFKSEPKKPSFNQKVSATSMWHNLLSVLDLQVDLSCLQVNVLVDTEPTQPFTVTYMKELLSVTFQGCVVQINTKPSSDNTTGVMSSCSVLKQFDVWCSHIQIDDMRSAARFPVIFAPVPIETTDQRDPHTTCQNGASSASKTTFLSPPTVPHIHIRCGWVEERDDTTISNGSSNHLVHIQKLEAVMQDMHLKVDMDLILELIKHIGQTVQEVTVTNAPVNVVPPSPRKQRRSYRATSIRSCGSESDIASKALGKESASDRSSDEEAALLSHEAVRDVFSHSLNASVHRAAAVASQAQAVYIELLHHCSLTVHVEVSTSCLFISLYVLLSYDVGSYVLIQLFVGHRFQHLDLTQQMLSTDSSSSTSAVALGLAVLGSPVLSVLSQLVSTISHTSPSFRFNSLVVSNYFGSLQALVQILKGSLQQQLLQQIYKVFGSMEVLGDPLELVESLGTGVADFFSHTK